MAKGVWSAECRRANATPIPNGCCRNLAARGEVTKKDIGAIRVFEMETLFQVAPEAASKFTILVSERKKAGCAFRLASTRPANPLRGRATPAAMRRARRRQALPGRQAWFHGKKFGNKPAGERNSAARNFGKPGGATKARIPATP